MKATHFGWRPPWGILILLFLSSSSAWGQTVYSFVGEPFTSADSPWSVGDRVTGSLTLADALPPFLPLTDVSADVVDLSFADGVQTRTLANSSMCGVLMATDGQGRIVHWAISLREAPTPAPGNPQQFLDLGGPAYTSGGDQGGRLPAGSSACDPGVPSEIAKSDSAGSWSGPVLPGNLTDYEYTGAPFVMADAPWMTGGRMTASFQVGNPLPPFLPLTDISLALLDFNVSDGVQTRIPANTAVCTFKVQTGPGGTIVHWAISLRELPLPSPGDPQFSVDSSGFGGNGFDEVGRVTAGTDPCGASSYFERGLTETAGSWGSPDLPPSVPTQYSYTGRPFSEAVAPWMLSDRVTGQITVLNPLPPNLPPTDIAYSLADFLVEDGVQSRVKANSAVCAFEVETDANGDITVWHIGLREKPLPNPGDPFSFLDFGGPSFPIDQGGVGPAPLSICGSISPFTAYGRVSEAGSWVNLGPVGTRGVSLLSGLSLAILGCLLAMGGAVCLWLRNG